jgi:hypothetical protein
VNRPGGQATQDGVPDPAEPRPTRRPLSAQPADVASAYDIALAGESALTRAALRAVLSSPARARTAVLAAEILGPPRSLYPYGTR